jgi:hypothetical protein
VVTIWVLRLAFATCASEQFLPVMERELSYAKPIAGPTFGFGLAAGRNHDAFGNYHVH